MLAERDHDFVTEQLANFRPVLDFFRRRLASFRDALAATEEIFRLAGLRDGSEEVAALGWLLFQARAFWLSGGVGEPRLRFAVDVVDRLRSKDRDLLMLAYWDALPEAELAGLLGCNRWLLRYRLRRARRNLAAALAPSVAGIEDFVRTGGGPVAADLRDADPATAGPDDEREHVPDDVPDDVPGQQPLQDLSMLARYTLKRISDEGAVFSDGAASSGTGRRSARLATRRRRRWPVLAAAVGLVAALCLAGSAVNGLWNQDAAQPAADSTPAAAAGDPSAPGAVLHSRLRGSAGLQAPEHAGTAPQGDSACSIRNVATAYTSRLFSTRDLTSHPEYFTLFACAGGWMSFGISAEGRPYLAAPGPDTSFFLATLDDGGQYVFDPRQPYSIMASWPTVGAWAGQLGEGMSAPELMDRQFEIKGGPVALREQLVGDGLSDRL